MVDKDSASKNIDETSRLRAVELSFMRSIEEKNKQRAEKFIRTRRNNRITGGLLGFGVLSIYFYSMFAIRQESFLDDFDRPEKIAK